MDLGVEGMMISPAYRYEKAPDQEHFLPQTTQQRALQADFGKSQPSLEIQPFAPFPPLSARQNRI